jgi:hypothetical protein
MAMAKQERTAGSVRDFVGWFASGHPQVQKMEGWTTISLNP